jgi:hypothetical protein
MYCREPQTSPPVEADRIEVVVRRDQPQPAASPPDRLKRDLFQERGPDACSPTQRVERNQLAAIVDEPKRGKSRELAASGRDQSRQPRRIVSLAAADDQR